MINANFTTKYLRTCGATAEYEVANTEGMTEAEIIDACDRNNFGGRVYGSRVQVYID